MNEFKGFWIFASIIWVLAALASVSFLGVVIWGIYEIVSWLVTK